jgi:hypothetical protein
MTKTLDSTAVYAYTTLISMIVCVPIALIAEGPALQGAAAAAIAKVGMLDVNSIICSTVSVPYWDDPHKHACRVHQMEHDSDGSMPNVQLVA